VELIKEHTHIYVFFFTTVELIKEHPVWFYQALEIIIAHYFSDSCLTSDTLDVHVGAVGGLWSFVHGRKEGLSGKVFTIKR
jgi:hypothetical protein